MSLCEHDDDGDDGDDEDDDDDDDDDDDVRKYNVSALVIV